jgi:transcriptional regulator GlxA family with amidase domain
MVIFPGVEELDFVGPWELLSLWSKLPSGPGNRMVVAQTMAPVLCAKGLSVNPHLPFELCPDLDLLLVPGGIGSRFEVDNPVLIKFIRKQAKRATAVLSICTGAFLLHRAGLLSGKRATTHWASLERLRALGDVDVAEERFVRDGDIWTSAGVSAGMDLVLAFIASQAGEEVAGQVQMDAEYFPIGQPHGNPQDHPQAPRYLRGERP